MSLNDTPSGERLHISFFGKRNVGKSSLVNAITGQDLSIVSDVKGTTTDPVHKSMELLPIGPVLIIDTPGIDDEGDLGQMRIKKTKEILNRTDVAVLVTDGSEGLTTPDKQLIDLFKEKEIPYITVYNKADLVDEDPAEGQDNAISVSALKGEKIYELKEMIGALGKANENQRTLLGDLIQPGDFVLLVVPVDSAAPKGRLILPQQQVLRDVLDHKAIGIVCQDDAVADTLARLPFPPALVVTDSQAFKQVSRDVPDNVPLTSFSILMARYKGFLETALDGVDAINHLPDKAHVLISEGCTHHRQCEDIGTVKLPRWLKEHSDRDITIETSSGRSFPEDLSPYDCIIHCGGCMLNGKELTYRMKQATDQGVPFTNYGTAIAEMNGILKRSTSMLPEAKNTEE